MNQHDTCSRRRWTAGLSALGLLVAVAAISAVGFYGHDLSFAKADEPPPPAVAQANDLSTAFRYAANQVLPCVVTIRTTMGDIQQTAGDGQLPDGFPEEFQPFLKRFFGDNFQGTPRRMPHIPHQQGMGSGVIIDPSGIILTNNHVVSGGTKVVVRLHDGREFEATDVKTDPKSDVAVVRISGAGRLQAAKIGNSDDMDVGDWVLAVGAPFGLQETVTAGIISAKSRGLGIAEREEFLQTDAAINPGNSGGPLVNLRGEVVGINTAISTSGGGNDGVGFAVPVNLAQWVSHQLIENGTVKRAFLGVGIQQVTSDLSHQFGLTTVQGAVVTEVRPDTAAAKAGLQTGDVIVDFDGHAVANPRDLQNIVERSAIDKTHHVTVIRDGKNVSIDVTLQAMPQSLASSGEHAATAPKSEFEHLGLQVSDLTDDVAQQLNMTGVHGVVITGVEADSLAGDAGLQEGMVITRVGQKKVASVEEFRAAVKDANLKDGLLLLVQTSDGSRFVVLKQ